ncbi:hypothetical protein ACFVIM_28715 [Streptomyces sp. NPDC057638]|uniref:hypothetical protein n=1 Tax=Streptomyces sp. NPDC057638 TaxID=3346190 RepID=UPI0036781832
MPLIPEEPQIHESAQGPRVTPATGRTASTPRPVPGPRPVASPRPAQPGPGPARPAPPAQRTHPTAGQPRPAAPRNPSQPQIQLIPAPADGAVDAAEEAVDLLLDSGRAPGEVLVLTTGELHPWAAHELTFGEAAYWAQQAAGDDVFYAAADTVGQTSLRPVVVVALNGGNDDESVRALSEATAKAGALLIVCGDSQLANTALGAGV